VSTFVATVYFGLSRLARAPLSGVALFCLWIPPTTSAEGNGLLKPVQIGVQSGFGAQLGDVFGTIAFTNLDPNTGVSGDEDGSIGLGFGLGDPSNGFATEIVIGITSVSTVLWGDGRFADEGNLNLKFHRYVDGFPGARYASLAIGVDNLAGWGTTKDYPANVYLAYSQVSDWEIGGSTLPLDVTLGYGSAVAGLGREPGAFASVGAGITPELSAGLGWIDDEFNFGIVYFPVFWRDVSLGATYADTFDETRGGGRLILSLSALFSQRSKQ
jgi:hypothetical protein